MSNISINLISSKDKVEESNLRSSLIFNNYKQRKTRDDLMDKTILSIIIENSGRCNDMLISGTFKQRFDIELDKGIIKKSISNLLKLGLIRENDGDYSTTEASEDDFLGNLNSETQWLIDSIIEKAGKMKGVTISDKSIAIENIRKALSVYFHMYGYSFFRCQVDASEEQKKEAISLVTKGLEKKFGQSLIIAIADTLDKPSEREKNILTIWAKAFISSQIMGLDPTLRNFKTTAFREKSFVLDTDVVLNCLANNAKYSNDYRTMVTRLLSAGCKMIIPKEVVKEVEDHANAAIKRYGISGSQIREYTDDLLESKGSNVFIEDYVKTIRHTPQKADMRFSDYIGNYYRKDDYEVLDYNLSRVFSDNYSNTLDVKVDSKELEMLTEKVNIKTLETEKGAIRTDDENYTISNTDAYLYLAVKGKSKESKKGKILPYNCYLLTRTTRTIKAAKELGLYQDEIVCNPNILISVLQETGFIDSDKLNVINLFENPFLAYSSTTTWNEIEPILADKQQIIKHKELQQLRHDFKVDFHKLITAKSLDEKMDAAKEITEDGYTFTSDLANALKRQKEIEKKPELEKIAKEEALKELEETKKRMRDMQNKHNTIYAKTGNSYKQKSSRTKKKGGRR